MMNRIPALRLFEFGRAIEKYERISSDITNIELYNKTINIIDFIEEFDLSNTNEHDSLKTFRLLFEENDRNSRYYPNDTVDNDQLSKLKKQFDLIKKLLEKELLEEKIIAYPDTKLLEIKKLIKNPQELFPEVEILINCPSILADFILFCQCYVYGLYTSSAIHILKATENYNIYFYEKISNTMVRNTMPWGELICKTETKLYDLNPDHPGFKKLKKSLEDLKANNRVKIIHHNKMIYEEKEAFKLFEECKIVISKMYDILKDRGIIEQQPFNIN